MFPVFDYFSSKSRIGKVRKFLIKELIAWILGFIYEIDSYGFAIKIEVCSEYRVVSEINKSPVSVVWS